MVTGDRADALFCDDPHDAQGVHSKIQRQAVIDRWDQAVRNRVNEPAHSIRLLIMQRLHEDDLSGHWLRQGGSEHLCLPMEFEPERQCKTGLPWTDTRAPGECLHPKRFPPVTLQEEKKALGSMGYAGQMQQRPAPAEGGMFRRDSWGWFRLDGAVPTRARPSGTSDRECRVIGYSKNGQIALDRIVLSVDASFKKTEDGSRVSAQVIGAKGADRFVLDNVTKPMDFTQTCECILALIAKWPDITKVLIEDKANGPAIINHLSSKVQGIIPIEPEGGKEARAAAIQPQVESGNVYLMEGAAWADDFVHELGTFPNGAKDDQVDALSQALIYLNQKGWRTIMLGRL
jgi:predicted phage terminase large subunit-like protein